MNIFLATYKDVWLNEENVGQEKLIEDLTESFEEHEQSKGKSRRRTTIVAFVVQSRSTWLYHE
jgi:hypothetical protein